eukprot:6385298-Prymnesium_polylepis.2
MAHTEAKVRVLTTRSPVAASATGGPSDGRRGVQVEDYDLARLPRGAEGHLAQAAAAPQARVCLMRVQPVGQLNALAGVDLRAITRAARGD